MKPPIRRQINLRLSTGGNALNAGDERALPARVGERLPRQKLLVCHGGSAKHFSAENSAKRERKSFRNKNCEAEVTEND